MRVISGNLKGRKIEGININGTRPTMDRVKESLFGMIQEKVVGSVALDLFAGSGSLGIEAISNGSKFCYFVDNNSIVIKTIVKNVNDLSINNKCMIIKNDYKKALDYFKSENIIFDIVFLDPPYKEDIISNILLYLSNNKMLSEKGMVVCEYQNMQINDFYQNLKMFKYKKYGNKNVKIFINMK